MARKSGSVKFWPNILPLESLSYEGEPSRRPLPTPNEFGISVTKDTLHYIEHVLALVPRHQAWVGRLRLPRWVGIKPLKKWRLRRLNVVEHVVIDTFGGSIWSKLTTKGLLKYQQSV